MASLCCWKHKDQGPSSKPCTDTTIPAKPRTNIDTLMDRLSVLKINDKPISQKPNSHQRRRTNKVGSAKSVGQCQRRRKRLPAASRSWMRTAARMTSLCQLKGPNPLARQMACRLLKIRTRRFNCLPQPEGRSRGECRPLKHVGHVYRKRESLANKIFATVVTVYIFPAENLHSPHRACQTHFQRQ